MFADDDRIVNLTWSSERIRKFCENSDDWMLTLDPQMTAADLEALYRRELTVSAPYEGLIGGLRFSDSIEVMGSPTINPSTPEAVLDRLLHHQHEIVREHAEKTLRAKR